MHDRDAEAKRWLLAAREDLAYARHASTGGFHAPACFHAQQAAEKAVKAVHYRLGARAVIGHNVRALIESLKPRQPDLDRLLDAARELDLLYRSTFRPATPTASIRAPRLRLSLPVNPRGRWIWRVASSKRRLLSSCIDHF